MCMGEGKAYTLLCEGENDMSTWMRSTILESSRLGADAIWERENPDGSVLTLWFESFNDEVRVSLHLYDERFQWIAGSEEKYRETWGVLESYVPRDQWPSSRVSDDGKGSLGGGLNGFIQRAYEDLYA